MTTATHAVDANDELDALLDSMMPAALELGSIDEEIIEEPLLDDEIVEAAIAEVDAVEARQEIYDAQESSAGAESENDAPLTSVDALVAEKPAKKGKKKPKAAKTPKEPKVAAPKLATSKKAEVLKHRLGAKVNEFLVFDTSDLELDETALQAKQEQFLTDLDDVLADKVGDKALMLFDWIAKGKGVAELNEVIKRGFNLLLADGELTSGDKGSLQADLLKKPYSLGTSRSQSNQIFCLFPALGIAKKEKGRMILNPDSVLLDIYRQRAGA